MNYEVINIYNIIVNFEMKIVTSQDFIISHNTELVVDLCVIQEVYNEESANCDVYDVNCEDYVMLFVIK